MSVRSRIEGAVLALALLAVIGFLVSAALGLHLRAGPPAAAPPPPPEAAPPAPDVGGTDVRVEVLNGSGRNGLARHAMERLRAAGFDVVYYGNADEPRGTSVVYDRGGRAGAARAAGAALGIRDIRNRPDAGRMVDVTVLLGKDWPPPAPPERAGWLARAWRLLRSAF